MPRPVDIAEVKRRLADRAEEVARYLLPRGQRRGDHWHDAHVSAGGWGDSLIVWVRGPKQGTFKHFAGTAYGDLMDLYAFVHRVDGREAFRWARGFLGLGEQLAERAPAAPPQAERQRLEEQQARREELERKRRSGKSLWLSCSPSLLATPAEPYLEARGVELARLVELYPDFGLGALRFHPALEHPYAQAAFPAIVALCIGPSGAPLGVHRTYLVRRGGVWDRLRTDRDGHDGKLLWCSIQGAAIPLWRGARLNPETGELKKGQPYTAAPDGSECTLLEGIEKGLAVVQARPERRVVSVVSLPNFTMLRIPASYTDVTWCGDRLPDPEAWARDGEAWARTQGMSEAELRRHADRRRQAAQNVLELDRKGCARLIGEGRSVRVARPPPGFDDWDDALRSQRPSAA